MRFRLVFKGQLKTHNSTSLAAKHEIRRGFHAQLKRLWEQEPLAASRKYIEVENAEGSESSLICPVGRFSFAPLVSNMHGWNTVAELDILMLRDSTPGDLVNHGGDLDNRIKVLLDSLRMPTADELPRDTSPTDDELPFFVLLKDDALVTGFSVRTDRLLRPCVERQEVELLITVNLTTTRTSWMNVGI